MNELNRIEGELWIPVIGYENLYEISNLGRVKSITFRNNKTTNRRDKILCSTDNGNGYLIVSLCKNGKRNNHYIHRLVANAFLIPDTTKTFVNHLDFNKTNNIPENLSWCTQKENVVFSSDRMRHPKSVCKKSSTGEKYIMLRNGRFRVLIKSIGVDRSFQIIEQAIEFRNGLIFA